MALAKRSRPLQRAGNSVPSAERTESVEPDWTRVAGDSRLLISAAELGKLLGVNKSTVWNWHSSGRIPMPVHIGGTTRWKAEEIRRWVEAGCPPRAQWELLRADERMLKP